MPLSDVTRAGVRRALEEYDRLGRSGFLATYGFGKARSYFLIHDGRQYDSKAIMGVAHGYSGERLKPLMPSEFSGGLATVARVLRDLGFEVTGDDDGSRPPQAPDPDTQTPAIADGPLLALRQPGEAARTSTRSGQRRSAHSKEIGDQGERLVLAHLRAVLPERSEKTLRWVAQAGETPGWDIEYRLDTQLIGVEVKATSDPVLLSIEMTANEWNAAKELGARYRIALVADVWAPSPSIWFLEDPARLLADGFLASQPVRWRITRVRAMRRRAM